MRSASGAGISLLSLRALDCSAPTPAASARLVLGPFPVASNPYGVMAADFWPAR